MYNEIDEADFAKFVLNQPPELLKSITPEQLITLYQFDLDRLNREIEDCLNEIENINNEARLSSHLRTLGITLNTDYINDFGFGNRSSLN